MSDNSNLNNLFVRVSYRLLVARTVLLCLCIYGCTNYCLPQEMVDYAINIQGGKHIFLTNICLYLTVILMLMGLAIRYYNVKRLIPSYVNLLSVLLPLELLVTVLFWGLFLYEPTLVRDKELYDRGVRVDLLSDFCMHLFPFLSLLFEQYDVKIVRDKVHVFFLSVFCFSYFLLCAFFAKINGFWTYPILDKLSFLGKTLLFGFSNVLTWLFYELFIYLFSGKAFFIISKTFKTQSKK